MLLLVLLRLAAGRRREREGLPVAVFLYFTSINVIVCKFTSFKGTEEENYYYSRVVLALPPLWSSEFIYNRRHDGRSWAFRGQVAMLRGEAR